MKSQKIAKSGVCGKLNLLMESILIYGKQIFNTVYPWLRVASVLKHAQSSFSRFDILSEHPTKFNF